MQFINHQDIGSRQLYQLIHQGRIKLAGNQKLKIYGCLDCSSGKRMLKKHRIFFATEQSAKEQGYRPCGHCMKDAYKKWRHDII